MKTRSHQGIAERERIALGLPAYKPENPCKVDPDPARKVCRSCGRDVMFVRKSYRANRAAHWQHVGDGFAQYRTWGIR
jgi:hypothetical protein